MRKIIGYSSLVCLIGVVMGVSLHYLRGPWVWIGVVGTGALFAITYLDKNHGVKLISLNIGVVILTLGVFEAYLWGHDLMPLRINYAVEDPRYVTANLDDYPSDVSLQPHITQPHTRYLNGNALFQAQYTTNAHGLRQMPFAERTDIPCILFFGGSFTFGWGVNDVETYPYQVALQTEGDYQVHNFAISAAGPQQMLQAIEQGFVAEVIGACQPHYIFYLTIPDHVVRAVGIPEYSWHSARYILDDTGHLIQAGVHPAPYDHWPYPLRYIGWQLDKSRIYKNLFLRPRAVTAQDFEVYLAIMQQSQQLLLEQYPTATFHILVWGSERETSPFVQSLIETFDEGPATLHPLREALVTHPGQVWDQSFIIADGHPDAAAHADIAAYVVTTIIDP